MGIDTYQAGGLSRAELCCAPASPPYIPPPQPPPCADCNNANCYYCVDGECKGCDDPTSDSCCFKSTGGKCYNAAIQGCCNGQLYDWKARQCCDDGLHEWLCDSNKECCGGECCDTANCMACDWLTGEECVQVCDMVPCMKCDGQGYCVPCDPAKCESCVDGQCKVCGGDTNQKCCKGLAASWCVEKCKEEVVDTTTCSKANEDGYKCDGCGSQINPPTCGTYREYTGLEIKTCHDGCFWDQDSSWEICYQEKQCSLSMAQQNSMCMECNGKHVCIPIIGMGGGLSQCQTAGDCVIQVSCDFLYTCYQCEPSDTVVGPPIRKETCHCKE
jgi:hypothetical protein